MAAKSVTVQGAAGPIDVVAIQSGSRWFLFLSVDGGPVWPLGRTGYSSARKALAAGAAVFAPVAPVIA